MDQNRTPEGPRPPGRRAAPPSSGWGRRLALVCGLAALFLGGGALLITLLLGDREPPPPEPVTFSYRDQVLTAIDGLAVNRYGSEGFSTDPLGRVSYERDGLRARAGIDVSVYQGEIDWQAVAEDGVDFALIRLGYRGYTEGGLFLDSFYEANIQGALEAGLEVGVYFFSQAVTPQEGAEEAQFVLDALAGYDISYPVVFDWEPITPGSGARTDGLDGQTLTQCAAAFCRAIQEGGYEPMVYFNQDQGYLTYDLTQLDQWPFWLAEYDQVPDFYYHFDFWQYTHTGTVAGIQGAVDWNLDLRPAAPPEEPEG